MTDYNGLTEEIRNVLGSYKKVRYGEFVGAPWPYTHQGPLVYEEPEAVLLEQCATAITELLARAEAAEAREKNLQETIQMVTARAEKAEKKLDAAVFDLLRAEAAAEETGQILDDQVHPSCDYSLYLALHDSVSDIVNWEQDNVWREERVEDRGTDDNS